MIKEKSVEHEDNSENDITAKFEEKNALKVPPTERQASSKNINHHTMNSGEGKSAHNLKKAHSGTNLTR